MYANVKVLWEQGIRVVYFIYAQKTIQSADIDAPYMQQFNFTVLLLIIINWCLSLCLQSVKTLSSFDM